jgi:catechol 2,3-dioxygenase-like lactoylglutathione lyase family enzyme
MKLRGLIVLAAIAAASAMAQLAPPNDAGVSMGHIHLLVKDVDAQRQFWSMFGGTQIKNGQLELIQFPGTFIMLRKGEPTAGSAGSVVNHFGFYVRSMTEALAPVRAAGFKVEPNNSKSGFYVTGPDDVRIEILEDKTLSTPIAMHHIHLFVTDTLAVQAWYVKTFGATAGKRGQFDTATVPGVEISLSKTDMAQAPTKGRSVDHIGFEVKNLDALAKKLEAQGIKFDSAPRQLPNSSTKVAFLTDPWGTYIELTENLAPRP